MALLGFTLRPGQSIFDQVVFAAVKAFGSGVVRHGCLMARPLSQ
jgi:hypothetical protein